MIAARTLMNATAQAARLELRLDRGRAIRAVRIHVRRRVGLVQKSTEFPAVMHARVGHLVVTDQLVLGIRIHVVLVTVEALAVLLGPACILVFLPVFRGALIKADRAQNRAATSAKITLARENNSPIEEPHIHARVFVAFKFGWKCTTTKRLEF